VPIHKTSLNLKHVQQKNVPRNQAKFSEFSSVKHVCSIYSALGSLIYVKDHTPKQFRPWPCDVMAEVIFAILFRFEASNCLIKKVFIMRDYRL